MRKVQYKNKVVEFYVECKNNKCNFIRARVRKKTKDVHCPNCGWERRLNQKEKEELKSGRYN